MNYSLSPTIPAITYKGYAYTSKVENGSIWFEIFRPITDVDFRYLKVDGRKSTIRIDRACLFIHSTWADMATDPFRR